MKLIRRVGAGIWWCIAHIIGCSVAIAIGTTFSAGISGGVAVLAGQVLSFDLSRRIGTVVGLSLSGLIFGACLGGIQALLLRRHLVSLTQWAFASAVGWGVGFFIPALLNNLFDLEKTTIWILVRGSLTTFCASLILVLSLRCSLRYGLTWVVLSTLGGALGSLAAGLTGGVSSDVMTSVVVDWAVKGAIYGILVGFAPPPPRIVPLAAVVLQKPLWPTLASRLYWWSFANIVGPFFGLLVSMPIAGAIAALMFIIVPRVNDSLNTEALASLFGLLALAGGTGAFIGWAQWLILRADLQQARLWVPLTALGWIIGWPLAALLSEIQPANAMVSGTALGLSIGGVQWLLLRRRRSEAAWWPVVTVIALSFGTAAANLQVSQNILGQGVALVSAIVQFLAIYSLCTGVALLWIRHLPNIAEKSSTAAQRRIFWLHWVLISSVGWWLGALLGRSSVALYTETQFFWRPFGFLLHALIASACLTLLQLLILRKTDIHWRRWLLASIAGWTLGYCLAGLANEILPPRLGGQPNPVFAAAIFGLSLGLGQWFALYRRTMDSSWWIPVSVGGWSLSALIDTTSQDAFGFGSGMGTTGAIITGAVLAWLLVQDGEPNTSQTVGKPPESPKTTESPPVITAQEGATS